VDENVLCFLKKDLPEEWMAETAVVKMPEGAFWDRLEGITLYWRPRQSVEKDPLYKQVIPYAILQTSDGDRTACYRRNGTEAAS